MLMPDPGMNMDSYIKKIDIRWADLDPNFHMLHSRYYELGAYIRMFFFTEYGITEKELQAHRIGPILLREECTFRREIRFGDDVEIDIHLTSARQNLIRWSIEHTITRNGELSAIIKVDGSWINLDRRKMTAAPQDFVKVFDLIPKSPGFQYT
jgi:acyl-CoA thioester hydrolase